MRVAAECDGGRPPSGARCAASVSSSARMWCSSWPTKSRVAAASSPGERSCSPAAARARSSIPARSRAWSRASRVAASDRPAGNSSAPRQMRGAAPPPGRTRPGPPVQRQASRRVTRRPGALWRAPRPGPAAGHAHPPASAALLLAGRRPGRLAYTADGLATLMTPSFIVFTNFIVINIRQFVKLTGCVQPGRTGPPGAGPPWPAPGAPARRCSLAGARGRGSARRSPAGRRGRRRGPLLVRGLTQDPAARLRSCARCSPAAGGCVRTRQPGPGMPASGNRSG